MSEFDIENQLKELYLHNFIVAVPQVPENDFNKNKMNMCLPRPREYISLIFDQSDSKLNWNCSINLPSANGETPHVTLRSPLMCR